MMLKKNILYGYVVYILTITLFLIYIFDGYNGFNENILLFILSWYLFGTIITFDYNRTKNIFSFGNVFNLFGLMYSNFYICQLLNDGAAIDEYIYMAMELSYISMLAFNVGYYMFYSGEATKNKHKYIYDLQKLGILLTGFFLVSIAAEIYVIIQSVGFMDYFLASRSGKSLMVADYSYFTFYQSTIPLIAAVALYIYLEFKKKYFKYFFFLLFVISVFNAIIRASRTELLCILLPILFLLRYYRKITDKSVLAIGAFSMLLFGVWKSLYSDQLTIYFDSEFDTWYKICKNVLSDGFEYKLGESYFIAIYNLIIPFSDYSSLSTWYMEKYELNVLLNGGGRGFSSVLEAYINFNIIGNVVIYAMYGYFFYRIESREYVIGEGINVRIIINFIILSSIYMLFRSESYSLWKNMMWFKIYPMIAIFFIAKIKQNIRG